jgi:hypothetical protein
LTVADHRDLVAALLGVPGVAAAAVEPHGAGPGTLRLQLANGADEVDVAGAVNRLLRSRFGLAVDADRVRVLDTAGSRDAAPRRTATALADDDADVDGTGTVDADTRMTAVGGANGDGPARDTADGAGADDEVDGAVGELVQDAPAAAADPRPAAAGRLVIERVQLVSAHLGVTVSVTLRSGERLETGEAEGAATSGALHRSVAEATLRAVERMVDDEVRFAVEHVEIASTGQERTALVVVSLVAERGTQRLSGASVVRDDARQAVIRGVLAAVNRRVGPMLGEVAG